MSFLARTWVLSLFVLFVAPPSPLGFALWCWVLCLMEEFARVSSRLDHTTKLKGSIFPFKLLKTNMSVTNLKFSASLGRFSQNLMKWFTWVIIPVRMHCQARLSYHKDAYIGSKQQVGAYVSQSVIHRRWNHVRTFQQIVCHWHLFPSIFIYYLLFFYFFIFLIKNFALYL